jgi:hypothetical protein
MRTGLSSAVSILLNAQLDDYVPVYENNFVGEGFTLQIVDPAGKYDIGNWINIPVGYHSWIGMRQTKKIIVTDDMWKFVQLPCKDRGVMKYLNGELKRTHTHTLHTVTYSESLCSFECIASEVESECGCALLLDIDDINDTRRMCASDSQCVDQLFNDLKCEHVRACTRTHLPDRHANQQRGIHDESRVGECVYVSRPNAQTY